MSLCHGWGWQPPKTASPIHIRHNKCLSTLICCPWAYINSLTQLYPPYLALILWFCVTCGVDMMWLCHGWGWQPPQTASHIHISHIQRVWAHWYTIHWHTAAALHSYTHPTWVWLWGSGFCGVTMMSLCYCWGSDIHLILLLTSILDIYKVFEHIDMLSIGIHQQPYTDTHPSWPIQVRDSCLGT